MLRKKGAIELFNAAKRNLKWGTVETIDVFYKDAEFLAFVRESLGLLKEFDTLNYGRVQAILTAIIDSPVNEYWAGRAIGVYFDSEAERARITRDPRRYAARLVRFATEARILNTAS